MGQGVQAGVGVRFPLGQQIGQVARSQGGVEVFLGQGANIVGKGGKIFPLRLQALQVRRVQRVALLAPVVLQGFGQALGLVGLQGFVQQAAAVQRMFAQHALAPGINGEDGGIVHALGGQLQPPGGLLALGGFGVGGQ